MLQIEANTRLGKDTIGGEHSRLSMNVESIVSARTARPGGQKKKKPELPRENKYPFNDSLSNIGN